jgi:chitinase
VNVVSNVVSPIAQAGSNRTFSLGSRVVLDGSGSTDEDGGVLSYAWKQIAGVPVTLSDPAGIKPVFVAQATDGQKDLVFELTVEGPGGLQDKAKVVLTVVGGAACK